MKFFKTIFLLVYLPVFIVLSCIGVVIAAITATASQIAATWSKA